MLSLYVPENARRADFAEPGPPGTITFRVERFAYQPDNQPMTLIMPSTQSGGSNPAAGPTPAASPESSAQPVSEESTKSPQSGGKILRELQDAGILTPLDPPSHPIRSEPTTTPSADSSSSAGSPTTGQLRQLYFDLLRLTSRVAKMHDRLLLSRPCSGATTPEAGEPAKAEGKPTSTGTGSTEPRSNQPIENGKASEGADR